MLSKKIKKVLMIALLISSLFVNVVHAKQPNITYQKPSTVFTYMQEKKIEKPKVLIYHTHYCEKYADGKGVYDIGEDLANKLKDKGVIVEHVNIDFSKKNYDKAYYESRKMLLNKDLSEYSLILDIHRDYSTKANIVNLDGKNLARVMFVSTKENPNRKNELQIADEIMGSLDHQGSKIHKGVYEKYFKGINYYNQNLAPNILLLELGNLHNTSQEVKQTNTYLSEAIITYLHNK